jgi:hypothetical protein
MPVRSVTDKHKENAEKKERDNERERSYRRKKRNPTAPRNCLFLLLNYCSCKGL